MDGPDRPADDRDPRLSDLPRAPARIPSARPGHDLRGVLSRTPGCSLRRREGQVPGLLLRAAALSLPGEALYCRCGRNGTASRGKGSSVEQRNLGRSGLRVSVVGLGCNNFGGRIDLEATREVVHKALDLEITFFDEADTYGDPRGSSEACLGQILGDRRKDIVLATKFARPMDAAGRFQGASRRYIMTEVEASLRRLKTDWIDLYHHHQPDPLTPIEETLRALDDLVRQGQVPHIGLLTDPTLHGLQ